MTGSTLLEIAESYTAAINKGSVPCIESAWSYLCKNECLRAMQESLIMYSTMMRGKKVETLA